MIGGNKEGGGSKSSVNRGNEDRGDTFSNSKTMFLKRNDDAGYLADVLSFEAEAMDIMQQWKQK